MAFTITNTLSLDLTTTTAPSDISGHVNPSFAGFGIEPSNLFSFTGREQPNQLTFNLIDNLANYTGKPPHIRIGGNTGDYMVFDQSQNEWAWAPNDHPRGRGAFAPNHMVIGPRYFEAVNRLPPGTPVTWGLNMAYDEPDWEREITAMAREVVARAGKHLDLASFEIGNEPDLWLQNGFRSPPWGGRAYVEEWLRRAEAVWEAVLRPRGMPAGFFEVGCTASTIGTDFKIADLASFGAERKAAGSDGSYVASWNQHDYYYFLGVSPYPITLEHLTRLSTMEEQFSAWAEQVEQARATRLPYVVREMGIVGPIGLSGVSDVFGGALWTLNFLLYTASLGVASMQFHLTDNSNASHWQPVPMYGREPFVRPLYYGVAAFDQIIGSTGAAQVSRSKVASYPPGYGDFIRAYNVYQGGQLDSLVVVNGKTANASQPKKASVGVSLRVPASLAGRKLHLAYLTSGGADAANGTTWNGISYEESGDGTPTHVSHDDRTAEIGSSGIVTFSVRDSEAVVATIGRRLEEGFKPDQSPKDGGGRGGSGQPATSSSAEGDDGSRGDRDGSSGAGAAVSELLESSSFVCTLAAILFVAGGFAIFG